jgi:hypothetical protein
VYQAPSNGQFVSQSQKAMFTFISKDTGIDFYLNGNLLGSTTGTFVDSSYTNPTSTYWWGSDENGTNPLSMSIFHIMWYSASLTEAEVVQNYNAFRFLYNI